MKRSKPPVDPCHSVIVNLCSSGGRDGGHRLPVKAQSDVSGRVAPRPPRSKENHVVLAPHFQGWVAPDPPMPRFYGFVVAITNQRSSGGNACQDGTEGGENAGGCGHDQSPHVPPMTNDLGVPGELGMYHQRLLRRPRVGRLSPHDHQTKRVAHHLDVHCGGFVPNPDPPSCPTGCAFSAPPSSGAGG